MWIQYDNTDHSQLAKKQTRQKTNSPNSKSPKNQLAKFWSTGQKTLVNSPKFICQLAKFLSLFSLKFEKYDHGLIWKGIRIGFAKGLRKHVVKTNFELILLFFLQSLYSRSVTWWLGDTDFWIMGYFDYC